MTPGQNSNARRIVIADDEEMIRDLVNIALGRNDGVEVFAASNGAEAVTLVREHRPSLVLLDVRMPLVDGLEACRLIRTDDTIEQPTILMLSAMGQESDVKASEAAGADAYLKKPFSPRELRSRIYELLGIAA